MDQFVFVITLSLASKQRERDAGTPRCDAHRRDGHTHRSSRTHRTSHLLSSKALNVSTLQPNTHTHRAERRGSTALSGDEISLDGDPKKMRNTHLRPKNRRKQRKRMMDVRLIDFANSLFFNLSLNDYTRKHLQRFLHPSRPQS